MDSGEDRVMQEEQFILRLPLAEAQTIRDIMRNKPEKLKKLMKISLNLHDNQISVNLKKTRLVGTLKKLPTIIESYKTNISNNKSLLFKTADICHIADCSHEIKPKEKFETTHGICPPLKNVKQKRFRKTLFNQDFAVEAERVSKELYYLLSTDLEACFSKFELINEDENCTKAKKQYEKSLFGHLSSDSSEDSYTIQQTGQPNVGDQSENNSS